MTDSTSEVGLDANARGFSSLLSRFTGRVLIGVLLQALIGLALVFVMDRLNFLLAHIFVELFSVAVAWTIFFIVWNGRRYFENGFFIILGITYLFVGIIDTTHTIAYKGMNIFQWADTNLPTQLWIAARYMEGFAFLAAPFFITRKSKPQQCFLILLLISAAAVASIFMGYFPACHVEGVGLTTFKVASEYIISGMLLATIWLLLRRRDYFSLEVLLYLLGSIAATIVGEMFFTFYIGVYDLSNVLGHYFKFLSFFLLYQGVIVKGVKEPYSILSYRLTERNIELERSREELSSTQRITSTMLDNLPEEISLLDLETFRIIDANRTFIEHYGGNKDEIVGKTCHKVTHDLEEPCSSSIHPCPLMKKESLKYGKPVVHIHREESGKERFVEISLWKVPTASGEKGQVVHIARDVTDRMRAEQMREDIERVVRHDLRSPLNGIIGGSQLLGKSRNLSEEEMRMVEAIRESGQSVLRMVNHSLDMYKMAEGRYELNPAVFDLKNILSRIDARFIRQVDAKKIDLQMKISDRDYRESGEFHMMGEEQTIENLLSNLVENAIDASPKEETVSLAVREDREEEGEFVNFDIHNRGVVPEHIRDRFFERYVTAGKRRGTGLGTYSAWLITRAHGGRINFTTDEENGTHIYVNLPTRSHRNETKTPGEH